MKKPITTTLACLATLAIASSASALAIPTVDLPDNDVNLFYILDADYVDVELVKTQVISGNSFSGVFDLVTDLPEYRIEKHGFDFLSESIVDATAYFLFRDTERNRYFSSIWMGDYFDMGVASSVIFNCTTGVFLGSIQIDYDPSGIFSWSMSPGSQASGDLTLLAGVFAANVNNVPDTGAMGAILGMSILGMILIRRRSSRSN